MTNKDYTNIIDYLNWRGDLSFDIDPFGDIDALILARFSYLDFGDILNQSNISVAQAHELYFKDRLSHLKYDHIDEELFTLMAQSKRFKDLKLSNYVSTNIEKELKQFSAITISLNNTCHYLSFRGTDNTVNGWKEDLLMTFDDTIPSQVDALDYLEKSAARLTGDFYLGGHSKGGNLALYASLFTNEAINERIINAYSFDGPGIHKHLLEGLNDSLFKKIKTFIPQASFFGIMLDHKEQLITVKSNAVSVMQHNIYSWSVIGKDFIKEEISPSSLVFENTFHDYLSKLNAQEREKVCNIVFDAIDKCDAITTEDIGKHMLTNLFKVFQHFNSLDEADAKLFKEAITVLGSGFKDGVIEEVYDSFKDGLNFLKSKNK